MPNLGLIYFVVSIVTKNNHDFHSLNAIAIVLMPYYTQETVGDKLSSKPAILHTKASAYILLLPYSNWYIKQ